MSVDLRELRRAIGAVGQQAVRINWTCAIEVAQDAIKAFRRLQKEPTVAAAEEVKDLLERIPNRIQRPKGMGPAPFEVAENLASLAATEAYCVIQDLAEEEADEDPLDIIFAEDIEIHLTETGLVDSVLGLGAMSVIYGDSGSGKTFFAIDLACHIAAGRPWRDMPVEQGVVVYIAAESPKSVQRRIWACRQYRQFVDCPVAVVRSHVNLCDPNASTPKIIEEIQAIQDARGRVVLIVVDTLSRATAGGDENSAKDMTAFMGNCDRLRSITDAHLLTVHHCGKDAAKGARGHSSLRAATDTEIEIRNSAATVTKQRDLETFGSYGFKLVPFELGQNARGDTVTTCIVEPCDHATAGADNGRRLGPNEQTVYDALLKALVEVGEVSTGPMPQVGTRFVTHEQLRVAAVRMLPQAEPKRKSEAFERALTGLVGRRHIHHLDGRFWIGLG